MPSYINYKNYIYLYIFLLPFSYFSSQMGILTAILFIWWISRFKEENYLEKLKALFIFKPTFFMILFLLFVLFSYFWSSNKEEFFHVLKQYKYYFFMIPILFTSLKTNEALKSLTILGISFSIYAFFSILIYLGFIGWEENSQSNPQFLFRYMITGAYLSLGTLFLYSAFLNTVSKLKYIYLFLSCLCLFGLFINNGRAAQVSLFFTILVVLLINIKRVKLNSKQTLFSIVLFTFAVIAFLNNDTLLSRYKDTYNQLFVYDLKENYSKSSGQRIKMYEIGLELFKNEPILGVGAGDFRSIYKEYVVKNEIKLAWIYNTIHNIYLEYLIKYGVIGLSLFILPFIYLFLIFKRSKYFNKYLITISPLFIVCFFDSILTYKPFNNIFLLLFILLCIIAFDENKIFINRRVKN